MFVIVYNCINKLKYLIILWLLTSVHPYTIEYR